MDNSTSSQKVRRWLLAGLQVILALIALGLAGWQISKYTKSLNLSELHVSLWWLIAGGIVYVLFYVLLSVHWQYICSMVNLEKSRKQWLAFFASQPYKYLPSSVFTFTFRAKYAKQLGLSYKKSSAAQLVENYSMLATAAIITSFSWLVLHGNALVAVMLGLLGVTVFVISFDVVKRLRIAHSITIANRLVMLLLSGTSWIVAGLGLVLIVLAFDGSIDFLDAIGSNSAAFGAGILAIFAPGGLGVREFVYGLFGVGVVAIIAWRLITAIVDVIVGIVAWALIQKELPKSR